jgi:hypothetical protein
MSAHGPIEYRDASPKIRAVFAGLKRTRQVDDVNNFCKYLAPVLQPANFWQMRGKSACMS